MPGSCFKHQTGCVIKQMAKSEGKMLSFHCQIDLFDSLILSKTNLFVISKTSMSYVYKDYLNAHTCFQCFRV